LRETNYFPKGFFRAKDNSLSCFKAKDFHFFGGAIFKTSANLSFSDKTTSSDFQVCNVIDFFRPSSVLHLENNKQLICEGSISNPNGFGELLFQKHP